MPAYLNQRVVPSRLVEESWERAAVTHPGFFVPALPKKSSKSASGLAQMAFLTHQRPSTIVRTGVALMGKSLVDFQVRTPVPDLAWCATIIRKVTNVPRKNEPK